ncbi:MAG: cyclase family protein [Pirellulaceae bacterium]
MKLSFVHQDTSYEADTTEAQSIAIALQFSGQQPNHFGTDKASEEVLRLGEFVGSTKLGGSCNVDSLELIPHCNGTHTETVSHIIDDDIWVGHAGLDCCCPALLVTVPTTPRADVTEAYRPPLKDTDTLITAASLRAALDKFPGFRPEAIVLRTLPNEPDKRSQQYASGPEPAFLTVDAMRVVIETGCRHFLLDLPSVDRMYDDGLLTNHHLFWNVPERTHRLTGETRQDKTITEMVFVPDEIEDGRYLLNLQIPAFATDAAPSRPLLIPIQKTH